MVFFFESQFALTYMFERAPLSVQTRIITPYVVVPRALQSKANALIFLSRTKGSCSLLGPNIIDNLIA